MAEVPSEKPLQGHSKGNQETRKPDNLTEGGPSSDFSALIETVKAEGAANRREEQREDRGKKWREIITIMLLASTLTAVCWQVYEMMKVYEPIETQAKASATQAKMLEQATIAANRPLIEVPQTQVLANNDSVKIVPVWKNSGSSVTTGLTLLMRCEARATEPVDKREFEAILDFERPITLTMGPGRTYDNWSCERTSQQIRDLQAAGKALYIMGRAYYCARIDFPSDGTGHSRYEPSLCLRHNCHDWDCEDNGNIE